jgi:flavin reductase (DIM6/NTAB) family NADH-FMN oxidoreductase RutF
MTDRPADPAASQVLEDALRAVPAPVAVIGASAGGVVGGLTAAWLTRVSLDPAMLLVAIGRTRFTWDLLEDSQQFTVSLPAAGQLAEARLFGLKSRRDVDKWTQTDHVLMGDGIPALKECSVRFLCGKTGRFATGDHDCFVGEVLTAEIVGGGPALPMNGADYAPSADSE